MNRYIGKRQIEELIRNLPLLEALLKNLQLELKRIYALKPDEYISEEEILYALSIGNRVLSDIPRATDMTYGDKETRIIANNPVDKIYARTLKELINEISIIGEVVEKLNNSINGLTESQQYILRNFYKEGASRKTWKEIAADLDVNITKVKDERQGALEKISKVLRVDFKSYEFCMKQLDLLQIEEKPTEEKDN